MGSLMPGARQEHRLEIRLLGEPEVVVDGQARSLPASKKTRALLGYLVATARPQRRERLCELLWDGPDDPRAGLRWSLAKLRPLLDLGGVVRVVADRERVHFERHGAEVDVLTLSALSPADLATAPLERLTSALARFRGPFLEGLELSSCPAFHAWCVGEREALRAREVGLLTTLIERLRSEPARALGHARTLIALDPLAESPRLALMDLLAALGETRRALEECDDYTRTLQRELRVKPSFEMERRRSALGQAPTGAAAAVVSARSSAPEPPPALASSSEHARALGREELPAAPFVGRARELARLEQLLDAAGRGTPMLLLLGEPGIGKTRLLEELGRLARERGGLVLSGRAFEAELVRPYGAFIDALRGQSSSPFASLAADRTRLYDEVVTLLATAAREHPPLVLLLDDLQWFDADSAELLHYLARALRSSSLLLAVSARAGELAENPAAQRLVRALGRERLAASVELGPLADEDLEALVQAASPGVKLDRVVLGESAGNPLFALEAARALGAGSQDLVGSLQQLMSDRLGRLGESERALVSWAGALGRSFDVDVLARVTGLSAPELLGPLERLERHSILRSRDAGYDFAHDLLRQAAYRQMSGPRQRLVHAQIARALADAPDADGALASDVAHHAALAGDDGLAARACINAGRRCVRLFASRQARELSLRGRRLAASLPDAERVPILIELIAIEVLAEPRPDLETSIASLAEEARALGLAAVEARAWFLRSVLAFRAGDSKSAFESTLSRVEATRHASALEHGTELAGAARCFLLLEKNLDVAEQFITRARALLGEHSEPLDVIWARGLLARVRDDLDAAAERLGRALLLARRQQMHWEECECLVELAWVDLDRARPDRVLVHADELAQVADKVVESAYVPLVDSLRALARLTQGGGVEEHLAALERTLPALREVGASRLLSIIQNRAARWALAAGLDVRAQGHAEQALEAARRVERVSEAAAARATLAEIALSAREIAVARRHLDELAAYAIGPDLPARSARAILRARELACNHDPMSESG
jgi:DNA-binding SARP family transcriptional activator